jgi:hypothetical protein
LISWQTRTIAQFVAATVPVEKGKKNGLLDSADKIALDDIERKERDREQEALASAPAENAPGSYEALLTGFRPPPG